MARPYVDDGSRGINLPPNRRRWDGTAMHDPKITVPGYTGARVHTCPDSGAEVEQTGGYGYWCPACRLEHPFGYLVPGGVDDDD